MESFVKLLRIIIATALSHLVYSDCPSNELVYPCSCINSDIICGQTVVKLEPVLKTLSERSTTKHFNQLFLRNASITALENNTFNEITFTRITIDNSTKLERIEVNAFAGTATQIQEFHLVGHTKINASKAEIVENLFGALRTLINAKTITLDPYLLHSIPNYAFELPDGHHLALEYLSFNEIGTRNGSILKVGREAFYSLTKLSNLNLNGHQIEKIWDTVFNFAEPSIDIIPLIINLSDNNIEGNGFEFGSFFDTHRPLVLVLDDNPITFLDDKVFNPFLHKNPNNRIVMANDPISCDCRMFWLMKMKFEIRDTIKEQVSHIVCHGGLHNNISFWDLKLGDFDECQ